MIKIITTGLVAGAILLIVSLIGLYLINLMAPSVAAQYVDTAFIIEPHKNILYYTHPFIISMALSWFWVRYKSALTGTFINKGIEFGLIYSLVAVFPMMWLIYAAMSVSLEIVTTWFVITIIQGIVAGLVIEKMNP
jgi:hypothetical protein